jgi:hypothetical protein
MRHRLVIACALGGILAGSFLACAQIIGADFDVSPCPNDRCVETIAANVDLPWGIAVDQEWIYWTEPSQSCDQRIGRVMRRAKSGGDPVVFADGQGCANRIVVSADYVYWTNTVGLLDGGQLGGQVMRLRRDAVPGGDLPEEVATAQNNPIGLAVSPTHVYWGTGDPAIKALALDDLAADPQVLLDGGPTAHVAEGLQSPALFSTDQGHVYVTEYTENGGVWKVPMDAGVCCPDDAAECPDAEVGCDFALRIVDGQSIPNGIAMGLNVVYFGTLVKGGSILSAPKNGGDSPTKLALNQDEPADLATDGAYLYWTNAGDGTIRRMALPVGQTETVATDQNAPNSIAVDETYVYWTIHAAGGAVRRAPKEPQR